MSSQSGGVSSSSPQKPINWDDYERGSISRKGSVASAGSQIRFDSPSATPERHEHPRFGKRADASTATVRKQKSAISIKAIAQAGGVNSIENFARSWQRAAAFRELPPTAFSSADLVQADDRIQSERSDEESHSGQHSSLIRQGLERERAASGPTLGEGIQVPDDDGHDLSRQTTPSSKHPEENAVISQAPYLASSYGSSYGGVYGSMSSRINDSSIRYAGRLYQEQQLQGTQAPDKERETLLVKRVEREDGKVIDIVIGQSTLPQTIFNSVNVLVGVGLLSLPLGLKYSGWLVGMIFLFSCALVTKYTARILAKCLTTDDSLITFIDLAYVAFGTKGQIITSVLFYLELIGACVALVILFADTLDAVIPGWGLVEWKIACGIIFIPLNFVPLRYLSFTSVLGIVSCFGIVILVFADGFLKNHAPGSLREPAATYLLPPRWSAVPLSFGLLISPWGGHGVFPNIYRDMRHPRKYQKSLNITYIFTYLLDTSMAIAGFLMFGDQVAVEITSSIFLTQGYPHALLLFITAFIIIIPLTKIPLNVRPIVVGLDILCGLHVRTVPSASSILGLPGYARGILRTTIRVVTCIIIVLIAIFIPSFATVMALLGSGLTFSICIILPLSFYLRIFGKEVSIGERVLDYILIAISAVMAVMGTVWVFLPKELIGAD